MLSEANNAFACDLYRQLATENSSNNLFFSPSSMFNSLIMAADGARGETARQMGIALHFPQELSCGGNEHDDLVWDLSPMHENISALNSRLAGKNDPESASLRPRIAELSAELEAVNRGVHQLGMQQKRNEELRAAEQAQEVAAELNALLARIDRYEFRVGNALWVERSYPLRQDYVEAISRLCGPGGVFPVDFKRDREASRRMINRWVEEQTAQRIENLIPSGLLSELTRLIITSAIYFAGEWHEPFDESWTRPRDFTMSNGSKREISMMMARNMESASYAAFNADGSFFETPTELRFESASESLMADLEELAGPPGYPDAEGFLMLELAYKSDHLSMVLIAPNRQDGLPAIEEKLTATAVNGWIQQLRRRDVNVFLPSFEFNTDYLMSKYLLQMGMVRPFRNPLNAEGAEFHGMTESNDPEDHLFINEVIHKAYLKVDEMGTEAAAATAIVMDGSCANPFVRPFTPTFNANRPFLCIIRERPTGTILFMGRVMDPR